MLHHWVVYFSFCRQTLTFCDATDNTSINSLTILFLPTKKRDNLVSRSCNIHAIPVRRRKKFATQKMFFRPSRKVSFCSSHFSAPRVTIVYIISRNHLKARQEGTYFRKRKVSNFSLRKQRECNIWRLNIFFPWTRRNSESRTLES